MSAEAAKRAVQGMETDVRDIARWGELLVTLSSSPDPVRQEILGLIGYSLQRVGEDVYSAWGKAFANLGGTP